MLLQKIRGSVLPCVFCALFFSQMVLAGKTDTCLNSVFNSKGIKCKGNFVFAFTLLQKSPEVTAAKTQVEVLDNEYYPIKNTNFFLTDYSNTFSLNGSGQGLVALGTGYDAIQFKVAGKTYRTLIDHLKPNSQFNIDFQPRSKHGPSLTCSGHLASAPPGQVGSITVLCE